jgi:alginate O-acetyltransferase complex protein AlgI
MLFNSVGFAFFLPIVFFIYWIFKDNLKLQNGILLLSSYFFYSCWDYRFLVLLIFSTFLDYFTGIKIQSTSNFNRKKIWFWICIITNVGFLSVFKYYNFFIESFNGTLSNFGFHLNLYTLQIILPVGISFYTFHGLSYVIDVYKNRIEPEKNFIDYSLFVSFFPLLVAGPIERATHLLPQIKQKRTFNYSIAIEGLKRILWGLFKKIVIADNCAKYSNTIFDNFQNLEGSALLLGAIFFSFQIYCDFSGYSDIAIGTAKLFGVKLLKNFSYPYFSRDIAEFWRRWHISLSSWFKDYLYIPLGGSKGGKWNKVQNTLIIFLVSGFWHGANFTFIVWGLLNAIYIMPSIISGTNRSNLEIVAKGRLVPTLKEILSILITFSLTALAWIFFRSENVQNAFLYIYRMFSYNLLSIPSFNGFKNSLFVLLLVLFFLVLEWIGREKDCALSSLTNKMPKLFNWFFYYSLIFLIIYFAGAQNEFIYFKF